MAIGSTINYSVPAVGTTVATLNKVKDGLYTLDVELGDVDVPIRLELRPAGVNSLRRRFGASWKFQPNVLDTLDALTKGKVSVSLNIDATLGSTITTTALANHVRWALGALLKSSLLEDLMAGSLE